MSRHRRKRRGRVRRRRGYLLGLLGQARYWVWRYTEFPSLLASSPHLQRAATTMKRAELGILTALRQVGVPRPEALSRGRGP